MAQPVDMASVDKDSKDLLPACVCVCVGGGGGGGEAFQRINAYMLRQRGA